MTLEQNIERMAVALEAIAEAIGQKQEDQAKETVPSEPVSQVPVQPQMQTSGQVPVQQYPGNHAAMQPASATPVQPAAQWPDYSRNPAPINTTPILPPQAPVVQTSQPVYTLDDLAKAAMVLMDAGRQGDLVQLLASFGTESLPALPKEQYGAFATALRGMGAPI